MDLSIVIVNWNSVGFLRKCLASVYANTQDVSFEVIVIDNASFDGCEEMIQNEFPLVRFIQSQVNLGFARANNLASEQTTGKVILFLNPDAEVIGLALQCMVACLELLPDAGAVGPTLLNTDGSIQTSCIQSFPSILNQTLDSDYLRAAFPKWSLWGNRALFEESSQSAVVEGISGACLMIRESIFEDVGRFSSDYFMYGEDMDLCYRVQKAGWKNYYVGQSKVIHHGGQSTASRSEKHFSSVVMRESLLCFMRSHHGRLYARLFQSVTAIAALCRLSVLAVAMVLPGTASKRHCLLLAFSKWFRVLRWAIGLETLPKPTM
jgi:N-acetylglucosaminyl-diphospho-decaprenol L-rhamnosyltransferase